MAAPASLNPAPWYRRRARSWSALSLLSARRLLFLYLAVFFLFSIYGFYLNIIAPRPLPLALILAFGCINGAYSVLYPWLLIRHSTIWVWVAGIAHGFLGSTLGWFSAYAAVHPSAHRWGPAATPFVTAQALLITLMASYICFIIFIRKQATDAIRMQNELELAHGIQQTLVPLIHSSRSGYEIYGITRPSERVGGDLVDLVPSLQGDIAYVADVAGHGLQAGILMGMLKAAAHTALLEPSAPRERLPQLLDRLDRVLPAVKESHMYAAFAALQLGPMGKVRHALAGHPPVLHYCHSTMDFCELHLVQFPLGLVPNAQFAALEIDVAPGDLLVIATDGILEACSKNDREFGASGLQSCIEANAAAPLPQLAAHILQAVATWGKQEDDQTLLLVRCIALA